MQFSTAVVYVDDGMVPAVVEFYERAFGLALRFYDPEYQFAELETGAATIAVAAHATGARLMPGYAAPPARTPVVNVELAFTTDDVPRAFARAVAAGAVPIAEPYVLPWGHTVAYVRSVEGTIIGLGTPLAR